jgi:hypothetical protein
MTSLSDEQQPVFTDLFVKPSADSSSSASSVSEDSQLPAKSAKCVRFADAPIEVPSLPPLQRTKSLEPLDIKPILIKRLDPRIDNIADMVKAEKEEIKIELKKRKVEEATSKRRKMLKIRSVKDVLKEIVDTQKSIQQNICTTSFCEKKLEQCQNREIRRIKQQNLADKVQIQKNLEEWNRKQRKFLHQCSLEYKREEFYKEKQMIKERYLERLEQETKEKHSKILQSKIEALDAKKRAVKLAILEQYAVVVTPPTESPGVKPAPPSNPLLLQPVRTSTPHPSKISKLTLSVMLPMRSETH